MLTLKSLMKAMRFRDTYLLSDLKPLVRSMRFKDDFIKEEEMSLLDKIRMDQLTARKNRESEKSSLLSTLIGEAAMIGKNARNGESTDAEVEGVIRKFLKGNRENTGIAADRNDSEWRDRLEAEKSILESYLPKQLTEAEIREKLEGVERTKSAMMKYLKENFSGLYDGKMAAQVVDELIKNG